MGKDHFIGLELHDATIWEPSRVLPMLPVMDRWGYNALVLHQNDLLDVCTQLDLTANYGVSDLRLKKVRNKCAWLNTLVAELSRFGAQLFLEIKEPSFEDYALELYPQLLDANGRPDPMQPAWQDFCTAKVSDVLDRVPGLGGLIVNLSSPESRVSMPDHRDQNDAGAQKGAWFDAMISAFADPLLRSGKALYIRDFSYTTDLQSEVLDAVDRTNGRVLPTVKITAHDYFPRSANNPALARVGPGALVEVDTFGEHTGWGVIPNCRVGEFSQRFHSLGRDHGFGLLVRTSWEAINGANALDGLSAANVYALPKLLCRDHPPRDVVVDWLRSEHQLEAKLAIEVAELMLESWEIPAAAYWDDQVFPRHSCLPSTWKEGWLSMNTVGMGARHRELDLSESDPRLSPKALELLFADKTRARRLALDLAKRAERLMPQLPEPLQQMMGGFAWLPMFAEQFDLATRATANCALGHAEGIASSYADLMRFAEQLEDALARSGPLPPHHRVLFDADQVRRFAASIQDASLASLA